MLLLEVEGLFCTIHDRSIAGLAPRKRQVLKGVSLSLGEATSVALLGESGSGKTTLAKCIVGLQEPDSGTITFDGVNLFPRSENRRAVGLDIQLLFQGGSASLDPSLTILDSLAEGVTARGGSLSTAAPRAEVERLVSLVGVPRECIDRFPRQLSGGQRQRIAVARLLAVVPKLLLLDEPTSALDILTSLQLLQLLKSLQTKLRFTILYITHDVRIALAFCDRVCVLHGGVIVEEATSRTLREQPHHEYTARLMRDSRIAF